MVISAARTPPRWIASIARMAPSAVEVRTTGTIPISMMKESICCFVILPIDYRAVLGVVAFLIAPVMVELIGHGVLVELDPEARAGGQVEITIVNREWLLQVSLAERYLLLAQEIGYGRRHLHAGGERDRPQRIV